MNDDPEESIVVASDLKEAAGITESKPAPKTHDDEPEAKPRSSRAMIVWIALAAAAVITGILVFLGEMNSDRYYIACEPEQIIAQQGRVFPPWGAKPINAPEWKPIAIPPNAECTARETEDADELAGWYLTALIDEASRTLSAREVTKVDIAQQQLEQALLLARTPDRRDQRKEIERLLGDVDYWKAFAKLKDAQTALADAAKQFDQAASKRPRHVSDASAWSAFVKRVSDEVKGGPNGVTTTLPALPGEQLPSRPVAPPGVALPVEPPPLTGETPPPAPDAGVPGGGVLL